MFRFSLHSQDFHLHLQVETQLILAQELLPSVVYVQELTISQEIVPISNAPARTL